MKYDTKNKEDIKCLTTFSEWKDEMNSSIHYNKSEMNKAVEKENEEIKKLEEQIKEHKANIETLKSRSRNRRRDLRNSLNKEGYNKAVETGLVDMKKFVEEHPDFANPKEKEVQ